MVKVFLVDDHEVVRRGLIDLLSADPELEVIGEAGSVARRWHGSRAATRRRGARCAAARRQRHRTVPRLLSRLPDLRCLMLTSFTSDEAMLDAILAGASGYVVKDIKGMELAQAIKDVGAGRSLLDNRAAAALMAKLRGDGRTLRPVVRPDRSGTCPAGSARRGPDQQADRGADVPRREDGQELRVPAAGQAGHGTAHPGSGIRLQTGALRPAIGGSSRA